MVFLSLQPAKHEAVQRTPVPLQGGFALQANSLWPPSHCPLQPLHCPQHSPGPFFLSMMQTSWSTKQVLEAEVSAVCCRNCSLLGTVTSGGTRENNVDSETQLAPHPFPGHTPAHTTVCRAEDSKVSDWNQPKAAQIQALLNSFTTNHFGPEG